MPIRIIKRAYDAGVIQANYREFISPEKIKECYANFFIELCNEIRPIVKQKIIEEKEHFDNIEVFRRLHHDEIIHDTINSVLLDYDISPFSIASDVEVSVQASVIKGYLEHQQNSDLKSDLKSLRIGLSAIGGPILVSDWIYSLLQINAGETSPLANTQDELLNGYFSICSSYYVRLVFTRLDEDLAEDGWVTKRNRYGKIYRFEIKDDNCYGTKEVLGGSYEYVKHFADSETHEVHHLIPAKLLELTGILGYMEGPCIRMEIKDHEKTRSHKNKCMLANDYFKNQLDYLKSNNIRAAVEIEIADIQAKFGSKYNDAIKEVSEYVSQLEKRFKK